MIQFRKTDSLKTTLVENDIQQQLNKKTIPNLKGIGAREALYYLENAGITVKLVGKGQVKEQSIAQGKNFKKGDRLTLMLN
jgi:cell division protein FtsI (penicillin-binding protein 3)